MPAAAGRSLFWDVGFTSYTAIIGHMGSDAAATNSVAAVVRDLICCVCDGIDSAAGIMVGKIRWAMARFRKYRWGPGSDPLMVYPFEGAVPIRLIQVGIETAP